VRKEDDLEFYRASAELALCTCLEVVLIRFDWSCVYFTLPYQKISVWYNLSMYKEQQFAQAATYDQSKKHIELIKAQYLDLFILLSQTPETQHLATIKKNKRGEDIPRHRAFLRLLRRKGWNIDQLAECVEKFLSLRELARYDVTLPIQENEANLTNRYRTSMHQIGALRLFPSREVQEAVTFLLHREDIHDLQDIDEIDFQNFHFSSLDLSILFPPWLTYILREQRKEIEAAQKPKFARQKDGENLHEDSIPRENLLLQQMTLREMGGEETIEGWLEEQFLRTFFPEQVEKFAQLASEIQREIDQNQESEEKRIELGGQARRLLINYWVLMLYCGLDSSDQDERNFIASLPSPITLEKIGEILPNLIGRKSGGKPMSVQSVRKFKLRALRQLKELFFKAIEAKSDANHDATQSVVRHKHKRR
jgi:hypothetical protein